MEGKRRGESSSSYCTDIGNHYTVVGNTLIYMLTGGACSTSNIAAMWVDCHHHRCKTKQQPKRMRSKKKS